MEEARRELEYRPLVLAAVALCVGLTAFDHFWNLLFLAPLLWFRRPWPVAIAFVAGLVLAPRPVPNLTAPCWIDGVAEVQSVPTPSPEGLKTDVLVGDLRLRAIFPNSVAVSRGDQWRIAGKVRPLTELSDGLRWKGLRGKVVVSRYDLVSEGPRIFRWADGWRRSYSDFAAKTLNAGQARWLTGFAFRTADFDEGEQESLMVTGTVHLVAASGLHVGAIALVGMALGTLFRLPRSLTFAAVASMVALYAMATGLHLPTVRAAVAFTVGSGAYLLRRYPDGLSALALAVLVYLPFDPVQVYGLGFQLSTVVVGILALRPTRHSEPVRSAGIWFRHEAGQLFAISLVAGLATAPILAQREGTIGFLTLPANVLAVPWVMVAVTAALILHPLAFLGSSHLMPAVGGLVDFARGIVRHASSLPGASITVPPFSPYWLLLIYVPWILFWRPRARPCPD